MAIESGMGSYTNKLRVRSCGLLLENRKLLLVELLSPITDQWTWLPPGGGVQFGESLEEALIREFQEETGLFVKVQERVHINEVIEPPIHAIEFYYLVNRQGGELRLGSDPEIKEHQILRDVGFYTQEEMRDMKIAPAFLRDEFWNRIRK